MKVLFQWIVEAFLLLIFPLVSILRFIVPLDKVHNRGSRKTPIVITEQWFVQTISHILMKWYFEQQHFKVYMFNFSPINGGIEEGAKHLKQFMNKHKIQECIMVGISTGAVTSYVYAQRFGGWEKVKRLICMGGPFKGTPWAMSFFFLKCGKQILPRSNFVRNLQKEQIQYPDRMICVAAKNDEFVPRWSSYLSKARFKEVPLVGHNNLHILSKEVWDLVAKEATI